MTTFSSYEQLASAAIGVYSTNSFFIRFKSEADLFPTDGNPYPGAIPTHVHEFVHYLHNISTMAGIRAAILANVVVFLATQYLIKDKNGVEQSSRDSAQEDHFKFFIDHLNFIIGTFEKEPGDKSDRRESFWRFSRLQSYKQDCFPRLLAYQIHISGVMGKKAVNGDLKIGLNFITEGVAYEVEREVWKTNGVPSLSIDSRTPIFPYLAYEPLVNYLAGRPTTPLERIKVGNAALMHYSPSQGFVNACVALRKSTSSLDKFLQNSISEFDFYLDGDFEKNINQLKEFYAHTDKLRVPFEHYVSRLISTSKKRIHDPCFEEIFFQKQLTPKTLKEISSTLAEHVVIQEKSDGNAVLDYFGNENGLASSSDEEIAWFTILCSAIHFVKQHFTNDGRVAETKSLKDAPCPFSGACHVERAEGNPETCKKAPWKFEPKKDENKMGVCWYIAAIRSITPVNALDTGLAV